MAAQGHTVAAGASSFQDLEDMAPAVDRLPSVVPVDRAPVREREDMPYHHHAVLPVDTEERIRLVCHPSVDTERTEPVEHSYS